MKFAALFASRFWFIFVGLAMMPAMAAEAVPKDVAGLVPAWIVEGNREAFEVDLAWFGGDLEAENEIASYVLRVLAEGGSSDVAQAQRAIDLLMRLDGTPESIDLYRASRLATTLLFHEDTGISKASEAYIRKALHQPFLFMGVVDGLAEAVPNNHQFGKALYIFLESELGEALFRKQGRKDLRRLLSGSGLPPLSRRDDSGLPRRIGVLSMLLSVTNADHFAGYVVANRRGPSALGIASIVGEIADKSHSTAVDEYLTERFMGQAKVYLDRKRPEKALYLLRVVDAMGGSATENGVVTALKEIFSSTVDLERELGRIEDRMRVREIRKGSAGNREKARLGLMREFHQTMDFDYEGEREHAQEHITELIRILYRPGPGLDRYHAKVNRDLLKDADYIAVRSQFSSVKAVAVRVLTLGIEMGAVPYDLMNQRHDLEKYLAEALSEKLEREHGVRDVSDAQTLTRRVREYLKLDSQGKLFLGLRHLNEKLKITSERGSEFDHASLFARERPKGVVIDQRESEKFAFEAPMRREGYITKPGKPGGLKKPLRP